MTDPLTLLAREGPAHKPPLDFIGPLDVLEGSTVGEPEGKGGKAAWRGGGKAKGTGCLASCALELRRVY